MYSAILLITSKGSSGDIFRKIGLLKLNSLALFSIDSIRFFIFLSSWRFLNPGVFGEEILIVT